MRTNVKTLFVFFIFFGICFTKKVTNCLVGSSSFLLEWAAAGSRRREEAAALISAWKLSPPPLDQPGKNFLMSNKKELLATLASSPFHSVTLSPTVLMQHVLVQWRKTERLDDPSRQDSSSKNHTKPISLPISKRVCVCVWVCVGVWF